MIWFCCLQVVSLHGLRLFARSHLHPSVSPLRLHDSREGNLIVYKKVLYDGAFSLGSFFVIVCLSFSKILRDLGAHLSLTFKGSSPCTYQCTIDLNIFAFTSISNNAESWHNHSADSLKSYSMLIWSNDKCCLLLNVSFLIGGSLGQIEISKELHCLSALSQARLRVSYDPDCNCSVSSWIRELETFHDGVCEWRRVVGLRAMNPGMQAIERRAKMSVCLSVLL